MPRKLWLAICVALTLVASVALAKDHGRGKPHDADDSHHAYSDHDRAVIRAWYHEQGSSLPPGLAKKDRLPPGLERQLESRGTLPPGLQKKIRPCPVELERRLPEPPPGYAHTVISGHIVLVNRKTYAVLDVIRVVQ